MVQQIGSMFGVEVFVLVMMMTLVSVPCKTLNGISDAFKDIDFSSSDSENWIISVFYYYYVTRLSRIMLTEFFVCFTIRGL